MIFINIITVACLTLMLVGLLTVLVKLIIQKRGDRIAYIRSFKKGKGALIYAFVFPLLWVGFVYGGETPLDGFFVAIGSTLELVVMKYNISGIEALMEANTLYTVAIYTSFILVLLSTVLFALSLASQYLWAFFKRVAFSLSRKEKLLLFGNNAHNHSIYASEKRRAKLIVDKIPDEDTLGLYVEDLAFVNAASFAGYIADRVSKAVKRKDKIVAVINTEDDEKNIRLARCFIKAIEGMDEESREKCFGLLRIFVFGDPRYEAIYENITAEGWGCVSYVNKYQKMAMDFIDKYPFTQFMDERHIDYQTSLIREGVDINTVMIGFGKTNQQLFLTSVANNQFITRGKSGVELKPVKYFIFDKNHAENNKNLNHSYNRFKNELWAAEEEYLPLPSYPAEEHFYHLDVNDVSFYNQLRGILTASEKDVNYIVIAFGTDLENIDLAKKLVSKAKEWGLENLTIFVKVRGAHKDQHLLEEANCYRIGNENEVVYDIDKITGDTIFQMAQLRNSIYDLEYALTQGVKGEISEEKVEDIKAKARRNWYVEKSQMERDSSLYCCLSLRMKLHLMGLDYCPADCEGEGLTEEEYLSIYAAEDLPDTGAYSVQADGKPIVCYPLTFADSRRRNMAIHEHLRWNSFMISKGIIPATKQQILEETATTKDGKVKRTNGKNYALRRHGNLTTFDGLMEFRKMLAVRDMRAGETLAEAEARADVIKYDYQLLDDTYWLLSKTNQKIIKRK